MLYLGLDPGKSGGIAAVAENGEHRYSCKMPGTLHDLLDPLKTLLESDACFAVLEKVGPARGRDGRRQGVSSAFVFGENYGALQGILAALTVAHELVSPQRWQTVMACRTGGDKNVSKAMAQRMFPHVKVTHAIADALILAEYARRTHGRQR